MSESGKPSTKKPSKRKRDKRHSQETLGQVSPFAGLNIEVAPHKSRAKTGGQKQIYTFQVTDPDALEKDIKLKEKLASMLQPSTLESYLASSDPSDALRKARMAWLELMLQLPSTSEDTNKTSPDKVTEFVEGLQFSASDRIEEAKAHFFYSIFLHARLPLDPRREIEFMIDALEQVQKVLPKRKPGRKEDASVTRAWRRIEFDKMSHRESYKLYMIDNDIEAFNRNDFKAFQEKIRKRRSEEKKKQAKRAVATKRKARHRNSSS